MGKIIEFSWNAQYLVNNEKSIIKVAFCHQVLQLDQPLNQEIANLVPIWVKLSNRSWNEFGLELGILFQVYWKSTEGLILLKGELIFFLEVLKLLD